MPDRASSSAPQAWRRVAQRLPARRGNSLGLAPVVVDRIFDVMLEMNRAGKAVLLAEQNARISLESAGRAYVIETGRVVLEGSATELRGDPRIVNAYLQEF